MQEGHVAGGKVRRVDAILQGCQARGEALKRAASLLLIPDNYDAGGQRRYLLIGSSDDDNRLHGFGQQADDTLQHELAAKGQPCFGPAHTLALAATENNPADVHYRTMSSSLSPSI